MRRSGASCDMIRALCNEMGARYDMIRAMCIETWGGGKL